METTTIQVNIRTALLLRQLKRELKVNTYDDAITSLVNKRTKVKSMSGSLAKYYKKGDAERILKELQEERRKGDRY